MHQALYRKYRPKNFDDVVGQEHITTTLRNEIMANRPAHAYLLMGSRGTGKTTCAKLIAKAVNCLCPVEGSPCGECDICIGIDNGSMVDVVEIDAASNNGVDNIRDLRDEAHFLPNVTKYRVYIIDEAHMLSIGAVNALLKIMEEPPAHVIFILATTEIHKVPATIQSRCQRFDFKRITTETIVGRLRTICNLEGLTSTDDALNMIARLADGGMRDAVSLLDLCSAHSSEITLDTVVEAAGLIAQDYLFDIADAISKKDLSGVMEIMQTLSVQAVEYDRLCQQLTAHYRNLLIAATVSHPETMIICLAEVMQRYKRQASDTTVPRILYAIRVLQETAVSMTRSTTRRTELEIALAKMCEPRLSSSPEALLTRIEDLEAKINALLAGTVTASTGSKLDDEPYSPPKIKSSKTESNAPVLTKNDDLTPNDEPTKPMMTWSEVVDRLGKSNPALRGALLDSKAYICGNRVLIECANPIFTEMMRSNEYTRSSLKQAIAEVTGSRYSIGPYESRSKATLNDEVSPLDQLLQNAATSGIEIKTM